MGTIATPSWWSPSSYGKKDCEGKVRDVDQAVAARIWTRPGIVVCRPPDAARATMLAEGTPVRTKDFSQSAVEGPSMLPSMKASPGQRVQVLRCVHEEQVGKSRAWMERTWFSSGEFRQMSINFCRRRLPLGSGNCTQGYTSAYGEM